MMTDIILLLQIIKTVTLNDKELYEFNADSDIDNICKLAKKHDLSHLLFPYFENKNFLNNLEIKDKLKSSYNIALFRDIKREFVKNAAYKALNNGEIEFVPLKGAIISELYMQSWMRTSCDIDILIHEEDLEKALDKLIESGFETDRVRSYHDVSLYKDGVHIELHYSICENMPKIDCVLERAWDFCKQINEFEYHETPEFFIFHHIAHMCYHFVFGGCGIKPFIDLFLYKAKVNYSESELKQLLVQSDLVQFYDKVCELMKVWFEGAEHNAVTKKMEEYILNGGVYGSIENNTTMLSAYRDNKYKNFLMIVFPPYKTMCQTYPTLNKHKIWLPFYYIKRIIYKLSESGNRVLNRMTKLAKQDNDNINSASELLNELGLKDKG